MCKDGGMITGPRLRALREQAGLSQKELATAAGLTQGNLSRLEAGHNQRIYTTTAQALAVALGITLEEFLGERPPAPPETLSAEEIERRRCMVVRANVRCSLPGHDRGTAHHFAEEDSRAASAPPATATA